jgi:hypothetical protein
MQFSWEQQKVIDDFINEAFDTTSHVEIIATAGSGKTTVMLRLAHLGIEFHHLKPSEIGMATFTSAAGQRMCNDLKHRVRFTDTFHSIAGQVLQYYGVMNLDNELYSPDNVLIQFVNFLQSNCESAIEFKRSLKLWFIDEGQDNNTLMMAIAKSLSEINPELGLVGCKIVFVGDDDQNLMSFQGSSIVHIENFSTFFSPCKLYYLSVNFRCSTPIVELANEILAGRHPSDRVLKNKPRGKSAEQYGWEVNKIPHHQRISKAPKPQLYVCSNAKQCVQEACRDIKEKILKGRTPPHKICVVARNNLSLNRATTYFAKTGVTCISLKQATKQNKAINRKRKRDQKQQEGEEDDENSDEEDEKEPGEEKVESTFGKVVKATPYVAKGLEYDAVYILPLEHGVWPCCYEEDLEKERRVLFTAVTRCKRDLYLYTVMPRTSIFIIELAKRKLISTLFQSTFRDWSFVDDTAAIDAKNKKRRNQTTFNEIDEAVDEKEQKTELEKVTHCFQHYDERSLMAFSKKWIDNLNGCSLMHITERIFPQPFEVKLNPVAISYLIQMPPLEQKQPSTEFVEDTETETENDAMDDEEEDSEEEAKENDFNFVLDEDEEDILPVEQDYGEDEDYGDADYIKTHHHENSVVHRALEEEMTAFLDCWVIRYIQEMQRKYSHRNSVKEYKYIPAEERNTTLFKYQLYGFNEEKEQKGETKEDFPLVLTKKQYFDLRNSYTKFTNPAIDWSTILPEIYWTSACLALSSENLGIFYNPMNSDIFAQYKFMLDEMSRIFHFLVYKTKVSGDNGYMDTEWSFETFEDQSGAKKPIPYIHVGSRLICWCNEESNFENGFPQDVVLNIIAYACIKNVLSSISKKTVQTSIRFLQTYHCFTRKICTVDLTEWSLETQAKYLNYIRKAKKTVFDDYEMY